MDISAVIPYTKAITIDHTKVAGDLTDFPVLISFTDPHLRSTANSGYVQSASGYDILFYQNGVLLNWELETYVPSTGQILAWVKIPNLSSSIDTTIYAQYGMPGIATFQGNSSGVWSSSYTLVMHLGDASNLSLVNSVTNLSGTNYGTIPTTGQIKGGAASGYIDTGVTYSSGVVLSADHTISMWGSIPGSFENIAFGVLRNDTVGTAVIGFGQIFGTYRGYHPNDQNTTGISNDNNIHHFLLTKNGTTCNFYIDGVSRAQWTFAANGWKGGRIFIGTTVLGSASRADECRFATTGRSSGWAITEYNNQSSPSTFITVGSGSPGGNTATARTLASYPLPQSNVVIQGWGGQQKITTEGYLLQSNVSITVSGFSATVATGLTYSPTVAIHEYISTNACSVTGQSYNPLLFLGHGVGCSTATGLTYGPTLSLGHAVSSCVATGRTYTPTCAINEGNVVSCSIASAITYSPTVLVGEYNTVSVSLASGTTFTPVRINIVTASVTTATGQTYSPTLLLGHGVNSSTATGLTYNPSLSLGHGVSTSTATGRTYSPGIGAGGSVIASGFTSYATGLTYGPTLSLGHGVNSSTATGRTYDPSLLIGEYNPVACSTATGLTYNPVLSLGHSANTSTATGKTYPPVLAVSDTILASASTATGLTYTPSINTRTIIGAAAAATGRTYSVANTHFSVGTSQATGLTYNPVVNTAGNAQVSGFTSYATGLTYPPVLSLGHSVSTATATGRTYDPTTQTGCTITANVSTANCVTYDPLVVDGTRWAVRHDVHIVFV